MITLGLKHPPPGLTEDERLRWCVQNCTEDELVMMLRSSSRLNKELIAENQTLTRILEERS